MYLFLFSGGKIIVYKSIDRIRERTDSVPLRGEKLIKSCGSDRGSNSGHSARNGPEGEALTPN